MFFLEQIMFCLIVLLFPIFIYLIYIANGNKLSKGKKMLLLDIANFSALYMLIRYQLVYDKSIYLFLFINVPLVISFLNKRYFASAILSVVIVIYYYSIYKIDLVFLIVEYIIYHIIFIGLKFNKKSYEFVLDVFCFVKGIILSILTIYIFPDDRDVFVVVFKLFVILIIFYFVCYIVLKLIDKACDIMSLNYSFKELKKEKTLKNALFQIVHEVKNPLAVCKGYLSMMDYDDIDKVKKYNKIIQSEVERTLGLMEDFNDYTKIKINVEELDIVLLLQETVDSMKMIMRKDAINLSCSLVDDEIYINGDYARLKQVFVNLLKNAMEAIKDSGNIKLELINDSDFVVIKISDNGVGMNKETLKEMGKMFYTTKKHGTGIGVALSYEIVSQHNGSIVYESKPRKGTVVTVTLPKIK